ncbi:MAG: ATP-binding cassette domain-containing protein [Opitutaceae bacterium]
MKPESLPVGKPPPLLRASGISKTFRGRSGGPFSPARGRVAAVNDVSFEVGLNQVVGLVGESGSGKSTLGRCILRLIEPDAGTIRIHLPDGRSEEIAALSQARLRSFRRPLQIVFQDPYHSLNPARPVWEIVGEGLIIEGGLGRGEIRERVAAILKQVGLEEDHMLRLPNAFSGGQRQRIAIARALVLNPAFLVCDEVTSALDTRTQKQVIDLLRQIRHERGISLLFISHDLQTVASISDTVLVMRHGRIVEKGPPDRLFEYPENEYTRTLIRAVPNPDPVKRSFR